MGLVFGRAWAYLRTQNTKRPSEARPENLLARHQYNADDAPERRKYIEGRVSAPFSIPRPGKSTRVHINLWLFGPHKRPRAGQPQEVIIRDFDYQAAVVK